MYSIEWAQGTVKNFLYSGARVEEINSEFDSVIADYNNRYLFPFSISLERFLTLILAFSDIDSTHWNRLKYLLKSTALMKSHTTVSITLKNAVEWLFEQKGIERFFKF